MISGDGWRSTGARGVSVSRPVSAVSHYNRGSTTGPRVQTPDENDAPLATPVPVRLSLPSTPATPACPRRLPLSTGRRSITPTVTIRDGELDARDKEVLDASAANVRWWGREGVRVQAQRRGWCLIDILKCEGVWMSLVLTFRLHLLKYTLFPP